MPIDCDKEQASRDVATWAEPPDDGLATVIRRALWSSVGNAKPPQEIWIRIRQNITTIGLLLSEEENSIMLSHHDLLVQRERYKDLLREAEQERLLQTAGLRQPGNGELHRKVAGWIGTQMVRWGQKLQHYGTAPLCHPQVACER